MKVLMHKQFCALHMMYIFLCIQIKVESQLKPKIKESVGRPLVLHTCDAVDSHWCLLHHLSAQRPVCIESCDDFEECKHAGFGRFQWMMLFYTGMAWCADAMEMMLLSFLGPAVSHTPACLHGRPMTHLPCILLHVLSTFFKLLPSLPTPSP